MCLINWRDEYAVGTGAVTERHQRLFDLLNRLHAAKLERSGSRVMGAVLDELVDCAMCAFSFEEVALRSSCAKTLARHRREHEELVDTLSALRYEHDVLGFGVAVRDLRFVADLFCEHLRDGSRPCSQPVQCDGSPSPGAASASAEGAYEAEEQPSFERVSAAG